MNLPRPGVEYSVDGALVKVYTRTRFRSLGAIVALAATVAGADRARASELDEAQVLVRRVSAAYAVTMRGVVGLRTRSDLTIDGPMYHRHTPSTPWYVYNDGALVSSSEQRDARRPLVRDALSPEYLSEYHFSFAECSGCAVGEVEVAYDSAQRDTFHAHGYFVIDAASERVQRSVEIPYELPWPTRDGRLQVTWGETAEKEWLPLTIAGTFAGKLGPFAGVAHFTQRLSPYERFPHVQAAVDALTASTGATPAPAPPVPQPLRS